MGLEQGHEGARGPGPQLGVLVVEGRDEAVARERRGAGPQGQGEAPPHDGRRRRVEERRSHLASRARAERAEGRHHGAQGPALGQEGDERADERRVAREPQERAADAEGVPRAQLGRRLDDRVGEDRRRRPAVALDAERRRSEPVSRPARLRTAVKSESDWPAAASRSPPCRRRPPASSPR